MKIEIAVYRKTSMILDMNKLNLDVYPKTLEEAAKEFDELVQNFGFPEAPEFVDGWDVRHEHLFPYYEDIDDCIEIDDVYYREVKESNK